MPRDADDLFFAQARDLLLAFVRRRYQRLPREQAEDAVHTAIIRYLRYRARMPVGNPIAFLYTNCKWTAHNEWEDFLRSNAMRGGSNGEGDADAGEDLLDRIPAPPPPPPGDPACEAVDLIEAWVERTRPGDLEMLRLRRKGLKEEEIAVILGISHEAIRQRMTRLKRALRSHFSELGVDELMDAWLEQRNRA